MESALDLTHLAEALGEQSTGQPRSLPTPTELQELLAEAEMHIFLRQTEIPDALIRTAWYLHGIASANQALELFGYPRQKRAFEISAHIFDLALNDQARTRSEKLEFAFGAEMGYRRSELDPNATAVFTRVESLLVREPPIEDHIESIALEAAVSLLGFQTRVLFELYKTWLRQLDAVRRQTGSKELWSTMFGPAESVVVGCSKLLNFLALGIEEDLSLARDAFLRVTLDDRLLPDVNAKWVAGLLLDFADTAERNSIWRLLPPELPAVARQAFTLTSPAVLTLWPPQRLLFESDAGVHPLSPAARRLVLSVPTSSGKTLLAQLMVVCHLAAKDGGVCYVSPMRSLGREVRRSLRNRLRALARELGSELPDFGSFSVITLMAQSDAAIFDELDEDLLFADFFSVGPLAGSPPDVEVMTPERLAHLLRRDPDTVLERFKLFIFDEAHFLAEQGRGFTLESVLSFLHWRTKDTEHKIVLLSAALGNEGQLMTWLDPNGEGVPLSSTWRGPRRLHAVFNTRVEWDTVVVSDVRSNDWPVRTTYDLTGVLRLRPAEGAEPRTLTLRGPVGKLALRRNSEGTLRRTPPGPKDTNYSTPQYKMAAQMVSALGAFGSVLVVMSTRQMAQKMAQELATMLPEEPRAFPLVDFASQRLGDAHPLCSVLKHGVAFHHAALPVDVLEELEEALREGTIRLMTCTSTLTEGVNLPVRTVVIADTPREGQDSLLTGARLVNAMGRAGRAGKESEGWIVLVRAAQARLDDFDLMRPGDEDLEVRSLMATDKALESLAEFEERVRRGEDAVFSISAGIAADFASFIWFVLASEEGHDAPLEDTDLDGLFGSTLGFAQQEEELRNRWRRVAEVVRGSYINSPPTERVTWARSGTSLGTSRKLNAMAKAVVGHIEELMYQDEDDEDVCPSFPTAESALRLLSEVGVLGDLISLPENGRPWQFRKSRSGRSPEVVVTPDELLAAWVHGKSLADMAERFLAEVEEQDWRVEQMVDAVTQQFEHFLAWQLAALVELVNEALDESGVESRVCPELGVYVRYGVDSGTALRLLMSGVRSRRLANLISDEAEREGVAGGELRTWLASMDVAELRSRFSASSSELLDLLDYARSPNSSLLREFLEQGRAEIPIVPAGAAAQRTMPDETGELKAGEGEEAFVPSRDVNLASVAGEERPRRLGVFDSRSNDLLAVVSTAAHGDVQSILDTGLGVGVRLIGDEVVELSLLS